MPWLWPSTILLTKAGSHAFGTNIEGSDEDFRGVAIAPKEYYLGFVKTFEQAEQADDIDCVIYELRKFMRLAADCNPSILELLFVDEKDVLYITETGWKLRDYAYSFLSKKAQYTFTGYAISQLNRIKRHYAWLTNPPKKEPKREDYKLPNFTGIPAEQRMAASAAIDKQIAQWNIDLEPLDHATRLLITDRIKKTLVEMKLGGEDEVWTAAARSVGINGNFLQYMQAERAYNAAHNEWKSYEHWKASRNPARAELEAKYGYDTKHAMHLVRLMRMGLEILSTGKVIVKRPDAEELLSIRAGAWSYGQLLDFAADMEIKIQDASITSTLPRAPDRDALDKLCISLVTAKHGL